MATVSWWRQQPFCPPAASDRPGRCPSRAGDAGQCDLEQLAPAHLRRPGSHLRRQNDRSRRRAVSRTPSFRPAIFRCRPTSPASSRRAAALVEGERQTVRKGRVTALDRKARCTSVARSPSADCVWMEHLCGGKTRDRDPDRTRPRTNYHVRTSVRTHGFTDADPVVKSTLWRRCEFDAPRTTRQGRTAHPEVQTESIMLIGVPKRSSPREPGRPDPCWSQGTGPARHSVIVERSAGIGSGIPDAEYTAARASSSTRRMRSGHAPA